jgi:hypothetical protein
MKTGAGVLSRTSLLESRQAVTALFTESAPSVVTSGPSRGGAPKIGAADGDVAKHALAPVISYETMRNSIIEESENRCALIIPRLWTVFHHVLSSE